jgi:aspartate/methionine/tyrosine aminotransferase
MFNTYDNEKTYQENITFHAIHMEVGEPDLPPSQKVEDAYIKAIKDRKFHYTPAKGLEALRSKISEYYREKYSVSVSPERIIITPGTSGAFMVVFALLIDNLIPVIKILPISLIQNLCRLLLERIHTMKYHLKK